MIKPSYHIAGSACGQYEANPVFWKATLWSCAIKKEVCRADGGMAISLEQASTKYSLECDLVTTALFSCVILRARASFSEILGATNKDAR